MKIEVRDPKKIITDIFSWRKDSKLFCIEVFSHFSDLEISYGSVCDVSGLITQFEIDFTKSIEDISCSTRIYIFPENQIFDVEILMGRCYMSNNSGEWSFCWMQVPKMENWKQEYTSEG